jgi:hypothetical protein
MRVKMIITGRLDLLLNVSSKPCWGLVVLQVYKVFAYVRGRGREEEGIWKNLH